MNDLEKTNQTLQDILSLLKKGATQSEFKEKFSEGDNIIAKIESESDDERKNVQSSFNRIHDKLFTLNSILGALFLGLSKYPKENPIFNVWISLLPILNILFLILLERYQMEIHRHASKRMNWNFDTDLTKYSKMINRQNIRSLLAIIVTSCLAAYLAFKIILY